jgi:hypothetical protein
MLRLCLALLARKVPLTQVVAVNEFWSTISIIAPFFHGQDIALVIGYELLAQLPSLCFLNISRKSRFLVTNLHLCPLILSRLVLLHYIIQIVLPNASASFTPFGLILRTALSILSLFAAVAQPYRGETGTFPYCYSAPLDMIDLS